MTHAFATVAIGFSTSEAGEVEKVLYKLGAPAAEKWRKALEKTEIVHFMSISVVRDTKPQTSHLLIEVTADGGVEAALRVIAKVLAEPLEQVCDIIGLDHRKDTLADLLIRNHYPTGQGWPARALGLAHDGTPRMSVRRICAERELAHTIAGMEDISGPEPALQKLEKVRQKLWKNGKHKWVFSPELTPLLEDASSPPTGVVNALGVGGLLSVILSFVGTLLWPLLLPVGPLSDFFIRRNRARHRSSPVIRGFFWAVLVNTVGIVAAGLWGFLHLRRLEESDRANDLPPNPDAVGRIMETEGIYAQGLLASVSTMKPGRFRRFTLRLAFWSIAAIGSRAYRPGFLGPIGVIHFARWFLLPGTDKLFFWSNYDGAWESYVEDFIQLAHEGVTAIWSNTKDFPKTQKLFQKGAQDGDRLRRWARRQMFRPLFWYCAYPDLTLERIRANAAIRQGIATARTEQEAEDWLALFGSAPRPRPGPKLVPWIPAPSSNGSRLEKHQIPTLVFGGRGHLRFGECLVITMKPDDPAANQAWLRSIEDDITYGDEKGDHLTRALVLGLSTTGFDKLGLPKEDLDTFPPIFRHGMTKPWRSRALGDSGENEPTPDNWFWGYREQPPDAVLLAYAATIQELDDACNQLRKAAEANHQKVAFAIKLKEIPARPEPFREPFGFVDGISQPLIEGTPRAHARRHPLHMVEPGEFVLGYHDNDGYRPSTPTIRASLDPENMLAAHADGRHDLGRNGSYLVVRQLEQKVDDFEQWLEHEAKQPAALRVAEGHDHNECKELIKAKLMGRWSDGASLVRHRQPPKDGQLRSPDNDFHYAAGDPQGLQCPLGAHTRRANPRDSLRPDLPQAIKITNRHRIIRVSRVYEPVEQGSNPGTLFMCLNADIERQFEFIQQTWLLGRNFEALPNQPDAVIGCGHERTFSIPTRHGPATLRLRDFVRVRGGGYFFMSGKQAVHFLAHRGRV